ncbi:MAG: DUF4440 domain-containing protein [Deltaproteobacteria bacterium]|nr:DUF4440 domain-containing protein [Deltaproteobacteria bacterium]
MKNRINLYVIALSVFMALLSSSSPVVAVDDPAAIDQVRLDFNAAFNEGNAQAIGQMTDDNAILLPPGRPSATGRDNIVALYKDYFFQIRSKLELKAGNIQVCDAFAFVSGDFTRDDTPKSKGKVTRVTGHYLLVLKKQSDGKWKIARDIWNDFIKPQGNAS